MAQDIKIGISLEADSSGFGEAERSLDGLLEKAQEIKSEFDGINQESGSLFQDQDPGQALGGGLGQSMQDLRTQFGDMWSTGWDQDFQGLDQGLSGSISQGIQSGLDQAGPAWDQAWQQFCQVPQGLLGDMFSNLGGQARGALGGQWGSGSGGDLSGLLGGLDLGDDLSGDDDTSVAPDDDTSGGGLLGGLLGALSGKGGKAGLGLLTSLLKQTQSKGSSNTSGLLLSALGKVGLVGGLVSKSGLLGGSQGGGLFSGLLGGGEEGGGSLLGGLFGGGEEGGSILGGIFGGGEEGGSILGGIFGEGAGGLLSVAGPIGLGLGATSLGANLLDMPGPVEAIMGAFGGGGGHTQQSALATIKADMEYLEKATKGVQEAFDSAQVSLAGFATNSLEPMGQTAEEMGLLADRAGLGNQGLENMIKNMDPLSAKLVEASLVMADAGRAIEAMAQSADLEGQAMNGSVSQTGAFRDMIDSLADSMHLPTDQAASLRQAIATLMERFATGSLSVEALANALKTSFSTALVGTARDAQTTYQQMKALDEAIRSIPTEWTSHVNVVYDSSGAPPQFHYGGRVMHDGGWLGGLPRFHAGAQVSSLASDEVPIIARRGEYIVRAESVNAATLPLLTALNQTGRAGIGAAQAQPPQVNLHLEVHGNLLGSEDNLEELARLMERKLRDLGQARYGA